MKQCIKGESLEWVPVLDSQVQHSLRPLLTLTVTAGKKNRRIEADTGML